MSDSKKILFNKSILLSLKAELLKKQEEVQEKKHLPQHKIENFKPSNKYIENNETKQSNITTNTFKDKLKAVDTDELEACRKAKLALQKKAELYDHLTDSAGDSQLSERFLVNFKEKKQQEPVHNEDDAPEDCNDNRCDDDTDWIEFTDFLGRTRKCLKSDLEYYKERDQKLIELVVKDKDDNKEKEQGSQQTEKSLLVQKTNDYLQSLREKWEQKEKELVGKDRDIHYQDLLFDEARIHGVGYYSFSTDENERKKQMEELLKRRKETLNAQEQAEATRNKRDELIAARVASARARQRARAGLPPEDPQENRKDFTKCLLEFLTKQKNEADSKAKEEENKAREEREKERQKLRDSYVREWDVGKEGIEDKVKKFKEMSQEEYVEQQRSKRINEFAPFEDKGCSASTSSYVFDSQGKKVDIVEKTWSDIRKLEAPTTSTNDYYCEDFNDQSKGLFFSTKKQSNIMKYKNFVQPQEPIPIQNEIGDVDENIAKRKLSPHNTEIAPPPTYEYYGPVPKYVKSQKPFESNLSEAYAQGSKSLEPKDRKLHLSKEYDFTFD